MPEKQESYGSLGDSKLVMLGNSSGNQGKNNLELNCLLRESLGKPSIALFLAKSIVNIRNGRPFGLILTELGEQEKQLIKKFILSVEGISMEEIVQVL